MDVIIYVILMSAVISVHF